MAKSFRPTTPSLRFMTVSTFEDVTKKTPEKFLLEPKKRINGRNNKGRITVRHRGGGHRRHYRRIDFKRNKIDIPAKVAAIEYDPNRSARIALLHYVDGEKRYILAPIGLEVGATVVSGPGADIQVGNALPLEKIPDGTSVHNVELQPGKGGQMGRSAGTMIQVMAKEGDYAQLRLPSGELRLVRLNCFATIGQVGNTDHENIVVGKAGRSRWLGRRPQTRGVAKNHHDHPLGGGDGKSKGGREPASASGTKSKGGHTRQRNKWSNDRILRRRRSKRYGQLKL